MSASHNHRFEALSYPNGPALLAPVAFRRTGGVVLDRGRPGAQPGGIQAGGIQAAGIKAGGIKAGGMKAGDIDGGDLPGGMDPRDALVKRAMDVVIAMIGLVVMSIPMLLTAAAIRLSTAGPALFLQERIGLHGKRFVMVKFRTMRDAVERPGSCRQATRGDPRVTRIGAWLRRTSFDEFPQLLNVLAGTMSLVGPRPHAPGTCAGGRPFEAVTHRYADRHAAKPGMTGLAQIRGWRGETDTEEKLLRRVDSDLEYIATWSPGGDLMILLRTIAVMSRTPNAY